MTPWSIKMGRSLPISQLHLPRNVCWIGAVTAPGTVGGSPVITPGIGEHLCVPPLRDKYIRTVLRSLAPLVRAHAAPEPSTFDNVRFDFCSTLSTYRIFRSGIRLFLDETDDPRREEEELVCFKIQLGRCVVYSLLPYSNLALTFIITDA